MKKSTEVFNDLIRINNDRTKGYEKAARETTDKDADLRTIFLDMAAESRSYAEELDNFLTAGGTSPDNSTMKGDIYRMWMDVKATFSGKGRKAILSSCEFGEDAAQKAYEKALENADLSAEEREIVSSQKSMLKKAHDRIKRMRDTQPA